MARTAKPKLKIVRTRSERQREQKAEKPTMSNDDTKATHVVTIGSADVQGVFKIIWEGSSLELAEDVASRLDRDGRYEFVDPDTDVATVAKIPNTSPVVIQVWTDHRYRVTMIQARAAQAQQQGGQRIVQ